MRAAMRAARSSADWPQTRAPLPSPKLARNRLGVADALKTRASASPTRRASATSAPRRSASPRRYGGGLTRRVRDRRRSGRGRDPLRAVVGRPCRPLRSCSTAEQTSSGRAHATTVRRYWECPSTGIGVSPPKLTTPTTAPSQTDQGVVHPTGNGTNLRKWQISPKPPTVHLTD